MALKRSSSKDSAFTSWSMKDAKWWQFWMPQSGPVGGLLAGLIVVILIAVLGMK